MTTKMGRMELAVAVVARDYTYKELAAKFDLDLLEQVREIIDAAESDIYDAIEIHRGKDNE